MLIAVHLHQLRVRHGARTQLGTVYWASSRLGMDAADERARLEAVATQAASANAAVQAAAAAAAAAAILPADYAGDAAFACLVEAAAAAAAEHDAVARDAGLDEAESDDEDAGFRRSRPGKRRLAAPPRPRKRVRRADSGDSSD